MWRYTNNAFTSLILFFILSTNNIILCLFSLEELKFINYEVDILKTPVKLGEEPNLPVLHMTSKYGQQYQCLLPHLEEKDESSDKKDSMSEENIDIKELLRPLQTGACLLKTKEWWTYEFCYGHYIKQYHVEDSKIIGQVITLGLFESDFDWNNETVKEKFSHSKQRFHSQYYTNGSKCDLTGLPRNAEVRFFCEEDAGDYIYRVDEPGTCSYILTIHTSRVCSHPQLKPMPSNKANTISCSPLLSEEQYVKYLHKLNEEKRIAEEKRKQWLADQQERLRVMKDWAKEHFLHLEEGEEMESSQGVADEVEEEDSIEETKQFFTDKLVDGEEESENVVLPEPLKKDISDVDEIDEEEKMLLQEYNNEIEKLKTSIPPSKFASVKGNIQKQISKEFDTLLNEAEEDLDQDLSEETKDAAFSKLASTLNMLLQKLDKAEKDVAKATKELERVQSVITTKTEEEAEDDEEKAAADDTDDEDEIIVDEGQSIKEDSQNKEEKLKITEDEHTQSAVLDDDKLHVRIRRLDRKSDSNGKLHEMDFAQRRKLEQAVKEKLEKAGLDTGGRRIEVKIITAGYYDNEDGKDFHALSDEETQQFQNMIMTLLTGQQEAIQEMERHKKMEENYKFVWGNELTDSKPDDDD